MQLSASMLLKGLALALCLLGACAEGGGGAVPKTGPAGDGISQRVKEMVAKMVSRDFDPLGVGCVRTALRASNGIDD